MGKIDIDYQVLHDAFFKHQTKPPLTRPGDLYYEGKEFEAKNQEHKPGHISAELREVRRYWGQGDPGTVAQLLGYVTHRQPKQV